LVHSFDYAYLEYSGIVTVTINRNGAVIKPEQLHADYRKWFTKSHILLDVNAMIS